MKLVAADSSPSLTVTTIRPAPILFGAFTSVRPRAASVPVIAIPEAGINVPLALRNVTVNAAAGVSASPIVKATDGSVVPSIVWMSAIGVIVGGVLIRADAVTVKVRDAEALAACPSSTVTVMTATPAAAAVIVSAPVAAGVPYVTTGMGTTDGFDDTAVTLSARVSLAAPGPMPASGAVNGTPTVARASGGASIVRASLTGAVVRR